MKNLSRYRLLISGLLSPFAAAFFYILVYSILTSRSANPEKDWLFRLSVSTASMVVPCIITLILSVGDWRKRALTTSGKIGLALAVLSLGLAFKPITDGTTRWKQTQNLALRDVPAPLFVTSDINGNMQRLGEHKGQVVVVNIWATWCGPCRVEMPQLDRLYREHANEGLMVFGISSESVDKQKKFLQKVPVTYPLLTVSGDVPDIYREISRYPALFLINRSGQLEPAPSPEESEKLDAAIDTLLHSENR